MTTRALRGSLRWRSLRLCSRAPETTISPRSIKRITSVEPSSARTGVRSGLDGDRQAHPLVDGADDVVLARRLERAGEAVLAGGVCGVELLDALGALLELHVVDLACDAGPLPDDLGVLGDLERVRREEVVADLDRLRLGLGGGARVRDRHGRQGQGREGEGRGCGLASQLVPFVND